MYEGMNAAKNPPLIINKEIIPKNIQNHFIFLGLVATQPNSGLKFKTKFNLIH